MVEGFSDRFFHLASGLPVVAPAKGGVMDSVIPERTGVLVPPRDPGALASAVVALLSDSGQRSTLARGARDLALQRSWEANLRRLFEDYRSVLDA